MKYIVVDIGCIECGEKTNILGIFDNKEEAEKVSDKFDKIQENHWTGQHYFEIFEIKDDDFNKTLYTEESYIETIKW